jgi:hypothetical protein
MYEFNSPHGTVDDFPPKSKERGMLRVKFAQSAWNMQAVIAGDQVASVFGDQFFDDEPWVHFNPKKLMKWAWIEDMLGVPFEKFHKWLSGFDEKLATRWRNEFVGDHPLPKKEIGIEGGKPGPGRGIKTGSNTTRFDDRGVNYTLRRLARDFPEMLQRIQDGELSVNAAAIECGIRKKPTQAQICVKAFRKAENRLEALKLIAGELEPYEKAILKEWIDG